MAIAQLNPFERKKLVRELTSGEFGKNFMLKKHLGSGGFGEVFIARYIHAHMEPVVVKFVRNEKYNAKETEILKKLQGHENIAKIHGVVNNCYYTQIVMTLEGRISYLDYLEQNSHLHEYHIKQFFCQMASAVSFIHSQNIAHLDIKPDNMIMADDMNLKLIDFGLAKDLSKEGNGPFPGYVGTSHYMAIEMLQGPIDSRCCPKPADIWALGVTLFVSYFNAFPFNVTRGLIMDQNGSPFLKVKRAYSPEFRDLMDRMTCLDYRRRITATEILAHDWTTGNNSPNYYVKTQSADEQHGCHRRLFQTVSNHCTVTAEDELDANKSVASFVEDNLPLHDSDLSQENNDDAEDMEVWEVMNGKEPMKIALQHTSGRFVLPAVKRLSPTLDGTNKLSKNEEDLKESDADIESTVNNKKMNTLETFGGLVTNDNPNRLVHNHKILRQIQTRINDTCFASIDNSSKNNCTEMFRFNIVDHKAILTHMKNPLRMDTLVPQYHNRSSKPSSNLQICTSKCKSFAWFPQQLHLLWIHLFYQMASSGFLSHTSEAVNAANVIIGNFRNLLSSIFTISTTGRSKTKKQAIANSHCFLNRNYEVLIAIARFLSSHSLQTNQVSLFNAGKYVDKDFYFQHLPTIEYQTTSRCTLTQMNSIKPMPVVKVHVYEDVAVEAEYYFIDFPGVISEASKICQIPDYEKSMLASGEDPVISKETFIEDNGRDAVYYFSQDTQLISDTYENGRLRGKIKEETNIAVDRNDNNNIYLHNEDASNRFRLDQMKDQSTVTFRTEGKHNSIDGKLDKLNVISNVVEYQLPINCIDVNQLGGARKSYFSNDISVNAEIDVLTGSALESSFNDVSGQKFKKGKSKNRCKKWWKRLKRIFCCHN